MTSLIDLRLALDALYPGLFNAVLAIFAGAVIYGWRKASPKTFEMLPPAVQSFPALILGAVTSAAASQGALVQAAIAGSLSGLLAVGGHHALKASPLPYTGGAKAPAPAVDAVIAAIVLSVLACFACSVPGKFSPEAKSATAATCKFIDSGNPVIGALCLTAEELESTFSHVKRARAARAARAGNVGGPASVDICEAAQ